MPLQCPFLSLLPTLPDTSRPLRRSPVLITPTSRGPSSNAGEQATIQVKPGSEGRAVDRAQIDRPAFDPQRWPARLAAAIQVTVGREDDFLHRSGELG